MDLSKDETPWNVVSDVHKLHEICALLQIEVDMFSTNVDDVLNRIHEVLSHPAPTALKGYVLISRTDADGLVAIWNQRRNKSGYRGNSTGSPNHGHAIPGVWDSDNGDLANKPCAECAIYDSVTAAVQQGGNS